MVIIEQIIIKNFRSVGNDGISLRLGRKLTILVGPNNSGKSNILHAFRFLLLASHEPFSQNTIDCSEYDLQIGNTEEGEIVATFTFHPSELDRICSNLLTNLYPVLAYSGTTKKIESAKVHLEKIVKSLFSRPFRVGVTIARNGTRFIVKSSGIEPQDIPEETWSIIHTEMNELSNLTEMEVAEERIIPIIASEVCPSLGEIPPVEIDAPKQQMNLDDLRTKSPNSVNIRDYIFLMKEDEVGSMSEDMPFTSFERLVKDAFPQILSIDPGINPRTKSTRVLFKKRRGTYELNQQGDGLKKLLVFLVYLQNFTESLLIIDEPEQSLHPNLETKIIDYLLKLSKGQTVIATHSDTIVGSIAPELIESGDVVIYGVKLDEECTTKVEKGEESDIIRFLENLGIHINRYLKHMAALSHVILMVEGPSDKRIIETLLKKFDRYDEFMECRPFIIPLGGVEESWKIRHPIVDMIAKGDDTLDTPNIPLLILLDRDEGNRPVRPNEMILSRREIENLVLSRESIHEVLRHYLLRLGLWSESNSVISVFEKLLVVSVTKYIPRWALLKVQNEVDNCIRPLLMKTTLGKKTKLERNEICNLSTSRKLQIKTALGKLESQWDVVNIDTIIAELKSLVGVKEVDYKYIVENIPGKAFIKYVLPDVLVETAMHISVESGINVSNDKMEKLASSICSIFTFINHLTELPSDIVRLLRRMKELHAMKQ